MSTRGFYVRWVVACLVAETVGMTAAATAARVGQDLSEGDGNAGRWLALAVVVAGGLVEGVALGVLQGRALATRWPALSRTPRHAPRWTTCRRRGTPPTTGCRAERG